MVLLRWLLLEWLLLRWLLLRWLLTLSISKNVGYLADFGHVKKQPYNKTLIGKTECLSNFLGYLSMLPALHLGFPGLWRPPPALISTKTAFSCLLFLFMHPVFWFTSLFLTQWVRLLLVTYPSVCSTYVTYRTPYHASGHQALSIQPLPREAEDFPRGSDHSKHVSLPTYLAWLEPIYYDLGFVFMHVKLNIFLLVVKTLIKNITQQPHYLVAIKI